MSISKNIDISIYSVNRNNYEEMYKNSDMSIGKRVREARLEANLTQKALAIKSGIKQPTISSLESGESQSSGSLAQMAAALGVNALWLETGKGPKHPDQTDDASAIKGAKRIEAISDDDVPPGAVRIRRVTLRLSAGIAGFAIDTVEEEDNPIFFREKWLESRGYIREKLIALPIKGQSMEPGLYDGDTVVINTADTRPVDGEVYAVNYEGEAVVKRLVREIGFWWLVSDNPDQRRYSKKRCEGDACIIIGRVIHKQSERI